MDSMNVRKKRILAVGMSIMLMVGIYACGKENKWLFSLNGEQLYAKDVATFAYIYVTEYNIRKAEQLEEIYESGKTYEEYYKEDLEDDIIETILLYKEAETNKIKLSKEDKEEIEILTEDVMERFGEDVLKKQGVSESDIKNVYEMKYLAAAYVKSKTDVVLVENERVEKERVEKENYIKVYQVTFPTVQLDDNGMVQSDADGNLKTLPESEVEEVEEEATQFAEKAQAGEDMETLLSECSGDATGIEKYLKYEDLSSSYKSAMDRLSVGEVSDVIQSDYGYYVVRLLDGDAVGYSETIVAHQQDAEITETWEEEWEQLYSTYADTNKEYKNDELWEDFTIELFVK